MAASSSLSRPLPVLRNLLFSTDFSAAAEAALPYACVMAKHAGATLHVIHVVGSKTEASMLVTPSAKMQEEDKLARERLAKLGRTRPLSEVECKPFLRRGEVWEEVCQSVSERSIDLIVAGTRGVRLGDNSLGSVAEQILRHATCPVVVVGPKAAPARAPQGQFINVLLAVSYSEPSRKALGYALALTCKHDCNLVLLNVLGTDLTEGAPEDYVETALSNSEMQLPELIPKGMEVRSEVVVKCGVPPEVIVETARAKNTELIVMGARVEAQASAPSMRSTVRSVVCNAPCPVMTVAL